MDKWGAKNQQAFPQSASVPDMKGGQSWPVPGMNLYTYILVEMTKGILSGGLASGTAAFDNVVAAAEDLTQKILEKL
jgi:hypothetical protein